MSDSVWQLPLLAFRDAIESRSTPGCGAAAAVSADFGLALALKGLRLGDARHPDDERGELIVGGDTLRDSLAQSADDDVAAFEAYLEATRLPHDTPEQSRQRDIARQEAIVQACRVPLRIARACREGLALCQQAEPWTPALLKSDTRAGARLLHAGLSAVLVGLDANLERVTDDALRHSLADARHTLQREADDWLDRLA